MSFEAYIKRSSAMGLLGGATTIITAFSVDYRLGFLAMSLAFFWDSYICSQNAVALKIEEYKNKKLAE